MESSAEITRLCEAWWGKLADSTKPDQSRYAEQLLSLLGWRNAVPIESKGASLATASYVLRGPQNSLAAHFVLPGSLEPPSVVMQRGLDFCDTTRQILAETAPLYVDYAFITDLYRSYFYDVRTDELLLGANSPTEFRRDIVEYLTRANVDEGSLEEVRRLPRSHVARQLREWCHHWCEAFVMDAKLPDEASTLAIDRLLVLRYLFDHDILKRTGWRLRKRFSDITANASIGEGYGCGRQLRALFHDIWFDWKADLFAAVPALDAVLESDAITAPLLREFNLHSREKFSIATILESFNYGDAAEKGRVRMVPDYNEDREKYLSGQTVNGIDAIRLEIDLADEGYKAIFYWFDKLVSLYERLEVEFDAKTYTGRPETQDIDLFAWGEIAAKRPNALTDKFQHVVERGLTIYYSTPRQLRIARLMLHLHLINRYDKTGQRFVRFPNMKEIFQLRPPMLESDRKWIYQPPATDEEWYL